MTSTNADLKSRTIGHYVVGKSLGQGTFGKVRLGTHTITNEPVAIKILEKEKIKDRAHRESDKGNQHSEEDQTSPCNSAIRGKLPVNLTANNCLDY